MNWKKSGRKPRNRNARHSCWMWNQVETKNRLHLRASTKPSTYIQQDKTPCHSVPKPQLCNGSSQSLDLGTRHEATLLRLHMCNQTRQPGSREAAFLAPKLFGDMSAGVEVLVQADKGAKLSNAKVALKRTSVEGPPSGPYWPNTGILIRVAKPRHRQKIRVARSHFPIPHLLHPLLLCEPETLP